MNFGVKTELGYEEAANKQETGATMSTNEQLKAASDEQIAETITVTFFFFFFGVM